MTELAEELHSYRNYMIRFGDLRGRVMRAHVCTYIEFTSEERQKGFPLPSHPMHKLMANNALPPPDIDEPAMGYDNRALRAKAFPYPSWETRRAVHDYQIGKYDKKNVFKP